MVRLPDPVASWAILIGVSTYEDPRLSDITQVRNNLHDLRAALVRHTGLLPEQCVLLDDPTVEQVGDALDVVAQNAIDLLLVYYSGHGFRDVYDGQLYLALPRVRASRLRYTALPFSTVRDDLVNGTAAQVKVLILDCCYSGLANTMSGKSGAEAIIDDVSVAGTYTLTSTSEDRKALFVSGQRNTAFSGELLHALDEGMPEGEPLLTLEVLYWHLHRRLKAKGFPPPGRASVGSANILAIARNASYAPKGTLTNPLPGKLSAASSLAPRRLRRRSRMAAVLASALILLTLGILGGIYYQAHGWGGLEGSTPPSSQSPSLTHGTATGSSSSPEASPAESVRVYNNSSIAGLAVSAAEDFRRAGYNVVEVANFVNGKIPTSTVYFAVDGNNEGLARQFGERFNLRVEPRFEGIATTEPGLIVIVTNDYGAK